MYNNYVVTLKLTKTYCFMLVYFQHDIKSGVASIYMRSVNK